MSNERTAPQTVTFNGKECNVVIRTKPRRNTLIQLYNHNTGEPVATATAGMDEVLAEDLVYIKNYTENKGMLDALTEGKIVGEVLYELPAGFVTIPVCKLLV